MSETVVKKLYLGDHGGTYCGNPLGCAVAYTVIKYLIDNNISGNVEEMGRFALDRLSLWQKSYGNAIADIRGKGLLVIVDFRSEDIAKRVKDECLARGLFVTQTQDKGIRIFPALNIKRDELEEGLLIIENVIGRVVN